MSWLTGLRGASTYICPEHRYVAKSAIWDFWSKAENSFVCPTCRKKLIDMGTRWRPPKKNNDKAWKKVLAGDIWWDKKALAKGHVYNSEYNNNHITKHYLKQLAER